MMSVTHFNSDQVGAPVVNRTAGSLIAMLDACLVDGFGLRSVDSLVVASGVATVTVSTGHAAIVQGTVLMAGATPAGLNGEKKVLSRTNNTFTFDATGIPDQTATGSITTRVAAAGWQKVFSGTNKAVYRSLDPASTQTFFRIDDTDAAFARPTGYLTMSDVDTGTGAFSTAWFGRANGTAGTRRWWLAADERHVIFGIDTHLGLSSFAVCSFGDIVPRRAGDPYCAMISGQSNAPANWGNLNGDMSPLVGPANATAVTVALSRDFTQFGGPVGARPLILDNVRSGMDSNSNYQFPNGGDNSLYVMPLQMQEITSRCLRGRVPGVFVTPQPVGTRMLNDTPFSVPELPGRTLLWKRYGDSGANPGGFAIDVTGPW